MKGPNESAFLAQPCSWLFGEFKSDVGVLHPCSTQENKIRCMIKSEEKKKKTNKNKKNMNNKKRGSGGNVATPPEVDLNHRPRQKRN